MRVYLCLKNVYVYLSLLLLLLEGAVPTAAPNPAAIAAARQARFEGVAKIQDHAGSSRRSRSVSLPSFLKNQQAHARAAKQTKAFVSR